MTAFFAAIAEKILAWVVGLIADAIAKWNRMREAKNAIEEKNQQVLDQTIKAETKEERDNAAKEVLRDL